MRVIRSRGGTTVLRGEPSCGGAGLTSYQYTTHSLVCVRGHRGVSPYNGATRTFCINIIVKKGGKVALKVENNFD